MRLLRRSLKKLPDSILVLVKKLYYSLLIKSEKFGSSETEFDLVKKIIPEGAIVIDIGANVGHYTLLFSKLVGHKGRVLAFEPIPKTFSMLVSNVNSSNSKNVTLINAAISDTCKKASFTIPDDNLYQSHMDRCGEIHVMCFPLTSFLPEDGEIFFLKIDAEGCDEEIIRSSIHAINNKRPIVMAELDLEKANELADLLTGYSVRWIKGSHNKFFVPSECLNGFPLEVI